MPADFDALVVLETLRDGLTTAEPVEDWPGVDDPAELQAQIADWLTQYANAGTRKTYAYALGLPPEWVEALGAASPAGPGPVARGGRPQAGKLGVLHHLAWFRWCAGRGMDPRAATGGDVKAWLHQLDAAGAEKRTRQRMLSTLSAFYRPIPRPSTGRGLDWVVLHAMPHRRSGSPLGSCVPSWTPQLYCPTARGIGSCMRAEQLQ
jgi:hypothetical protein